MKKRIVLTLLLCCMTICFAACDIDDNVYTGKADTSGEPARLTLNVDNTCVLTQIIDDYEITARELAEYGITEGNVIAAYYDLLEGSYEKDDDGMITAVFDGNIKQKVEFSGSASNEFIKAVKKQYADMYIDGKISDEEYEKKLSFLNGDAVNKEYSESDSLVSEIRFTCKIDKNDKTFIPVSIVTYSGTKIMYKVEYEYDENKNMTKKIDYDSDGMTVSYVTEYYTNGSEKTFTCYNTDGTVSYVKEYTQNGRMAKYTEYFSDGTWYTAEYYSNGKIKVGIKYDVDGTVLERIDYDENGNIIE